MTTPYVRQQDTEHTESPALLPPPGVHYHHAQQHPSESQQSEGGLSCYERKQGCNRAFIWSWCLFILASALFIILCLIPSLISIMIEENVCDKLCVPIPQAGWYENLTNADDWKMNNWLVNTNRSQWPVEYFNVYLYNVTNSDAVISGAEPKLKVEVVGPYVFSVYRQKYNVSFSEDNEQVFYEDLESHMFLPEKSKGLSLSDKLITVNMPLISLNYMWYAIQHVGYYRSIEQYCSIHDPLYSCLFEKALTVEQILFGYSSQVYGFGNLMLSNILAPQFQLFFNYSTNLNEAHDLHLVSSYGMGGELHLSPTRLNTMVSGPPALNDSLAHGQYTGQGDSFGQIAEFFQVLGNTSVNVWNGPESIGGTDHFQFAPPVTPESILTIWDADVLRQVDLQFQEKVSVLDKYDAYRFTPTSDLFSGTDPHFFGNDSYTGLLFVSPVSLVHYCAPVPGYASRPYLAGVHPRWANSVECTNCPDMSNPDDWLNAYMDVEPNTGKVIGGKKRGQINVIIGQPEIYNNPPGMLDYAKIPESLVPVVYFEYSSIIEQGGQTDQLEDGLNQLSLAKTATAVAFYLLAPLSCLIFVAAYFVGLKADENGACFDRSTYSPALQQPLL